MNRRMMAVAVAWFALAASCKDHGEPHDHTSEHPTGHDHHEEGHGHGDEPTVSVTAWSDEFELFAEHPPGVAGQPTSFLVHLTVLQDFRALQSGTVALEFDGPERLRGESSAALRPGIFTIDVPAGKAGTYRGRVKIDASTSGTIEGLELTVFSDAREAEASVDDEDDHGVIEFLKEQQWGVPFATSFAQQGAVIPSVEVAGRIETPPGGSAQVGAPVAGRIAAPRTGLLPPGATVTKGQVLALLSPAPSSPEQASRASLAVAEAQARLSAAQTALTRAERLIEDEAISQRGLEDAQRERQVAEEAVRSARRSADLYAGATGAPGRATWRLTAPIAGTLVSVKATPGATVSPGDVLFEIVNPSELWIVARVPEQDAARLKPNRDASYKLAGLSEWVPIRLEEAEAPDSLVTVGRTVDAVSRTVDVIYALGAPDSGLRVGGLVQVSLPAGDDFDGIVIPTTALIDQDGRHVVYVQVDGEHFAERQVRPGPRSGGRVGIIDGLQAGERIVTEGAHLVRLADRSKNAQPHGHVH